jgi:hypothetical protein
VEGSKFPVFVPNPVYDDLRIIARENTIISEVIVYNAVGKVELHDRNKNMKRRTFEYSMHTKSPGVYFVKITGQDFVRVFRVFKN